MKRICAMLLLVSLMLGISTESEGAASKEMKAYKRMLSKSQMKWDERYIHTSKTEFALCDLNRDGIKELFLNSHEVGNSECYMKIFHYKNKVSKSMWGGSFSPMFYNVKKGILRIQSGGQGGVGDDYYTYNGKTMVLQFSEYRFYELLGELTEHDYHIKGKKVSRKTYLAEKKSRLGNSKGVSLVFHKNTAKNRKKYLG